MEGFLGSHDFVATVESINPNKNSAFLFTDFMNRKAEFFLIFVNELTLLPVLEPLPGLVHFLLLP